MIIISNTNLKFDIAIPDSFLYGITSDIDKTFKIPKNKVKEGLYWDLNNPYYFFRVDPQSNHDLMILGGADHRAEIKINENKAYLVLEEYLKKIVPNIKYRVIRRWNGPILEPSDGLALIGEYKPGQYVATAFSGNGMTYGTIAGIIIPDLILGYENPWEEIYDPSRLPTRAFGEYLS